MDLLSNLFEWVMGFTTSEYAILSLSLLSVTESIFFPIPPDPLLISISIIRPEIAIWLGILTTVSSVIGAVIGHWLGKIFGRPLLLKISSNFMIYKAERLINKYGIWAILISAFTPIPYKIFAISAGVFNFDRRKFILMSIIGRGLRFLSLAILISIYGETIEKFITDKFDYLTIIVAIIIATIAAILVTSYKFASSSE